MSRAKKEAAILWCLRHEPGMGGLELCALTGIWRSSIYVYLARMEERGLVRQEITRDAAGRPTRVRYYASETPTGLLSGMPECRCEIEPGTGCNYPHCAAGDPLAAIRAIAWDPGLDDRTKAFRIRRLTFMGK